MRNLPKDSNIKDDAVENVSQFINRINEYIGKNRREGFFCVYRGEPNIYTTPCRPNLFRTDIMQRNKFFEKSLFDAMRQNKLSGETRYLDNAIDAQHGEFPSRLLDVSYNCLTALYFAVTPYYHKRADALDDRDGMVFLMFVDEIYSPSGKNLNDNYDAIINRDQPWYQGKTLFCKNHKFVDHTKLNSRIIAQQGAFILFPGDEPEELPKWMSYGIRIPGSAKAQIRGELKQLFGIHTGSIYPEIINLVDDLEQKSEYLNTEEFCFANELKMAMSQLDKELGYYLEYAISKKREGSDQIEQILMYIERVINSYRVGLLELEKTMETEENGDESVEKCLREAVEHYNQAVEDFSELITREGVGEFSGQALRIGFNGLR